MRNCKRTARQKVHGMARIADQVHDYGAGTNYTDGCPRIRLARIVMVTIMVTMMSVALVPRSP
jgi:hypothetical protein